MDEAQAEAEQLAGQVAQMEAEGKAAAEKAQALGRMIAEVGGSWDARVYYHSSSYLTPTRVDVWVDGCPAVFVLSISFNLPTTCTQTAGEAHGGVQRAAGPAGGSGHKGSPHRALRHGRRRGPHHRCGM